MKDFIERAREVGARQAYAELYPEHDAREFVRFLSALGLDQVAIAELCKAKYDKGSRRTIQRWLHPQESRQYARDYMRQWRKGKYDPEQRRQRYLKAKLKERLARLSDSEREQIKTGFIREPSSEARKVVAMLRENPKLKAYLA